MTNPWANVKAVTPTDACYEAAFLILDFEKTGWDPDAAEEFTEKLSALINGVYLQGWRDGRDATMEYAVKLVSEISDSE